MEATFMNTGNNETNKLFKFVLNLSKSLGLKIWNKHVVLQNLSIYYTWKNTRQQYTDNKFKVVAPKLNDWFKLPVGSYSMSQSFKVISSTL